MNPPPEEGNGNPRQYSCLWNPMDRGAWQGSVGSQGVQHDWMTAQQQKNPSGAPAPPTKRALGGVAPSRRFYKKKDRTTELSAQKNFPDSSVGKESACSAGDPGLIPGSGRSPGEGIGYQLQYSWASLVAQLVKNPPAMWETWVWSLDGEEPLEKEKATHSSILAWRIPWTVQSMGSQEVGHDWATFTFTFFSSRTSFCLQRSV